MLSNIIPGHYHISWSLQCLNHSVKRLIQSASCPAAPSLMEIYLRSGCIFPGRLWPGGVVGFGGLVIILFQVRRVTVGAHAVPVLCLAGPVEPVSRPHLLFGIDRIAHVKPLASLRIPGYREALETAAVKYHQVLLKGCVTAIALRWCMFRSIFPKRRLSWRFSIEL